ncbi:MAG: hypothetical protein IJ277_04440 [Bacteroidaceae bacterium]|nr:hypothetical protein [Bacteroidaceae bacterium]
MKTIKNIFFLVMAMFAFTACMNDFDTPHFDTPPFGNNAIGVPNMTISEFKEKYRAQLLAATPTEITEDIIISGVVVSNDITGNVYKQVVISDGEDAIILGINTSGLYATLPIGQMVTLSCKGLSMGGYCYLPQIGVPYNTEKYGIQIGRMSKQVLEEHIKLIGEPNENYSELVPVELTEEFLSNSANKDLCPRYVIMKGVEFQGADGKEVYVPGDEIQERYVKIGKQQIIFRLSNYADFAKMVMPTGKLNITGVLTRYKTSSKDVWQFMLTSDKDITPAE